MQPQLQRILLATEHTEFDSGAERVALALAKRCGADLRVVCPLVSNPEYEAIAPEIAARAARAAAAGMDELRASARAAGVGIDIRVRSGEDPWREIVDEALERGADLLVTRRRGHRSLLASLLVGEMVSKVVAHAPCSVLMVPRAAVLWTGGVLAAVDGSPISERVAQVAAAVAEKCDSRLRVVSVATGAAPAEREAAENAVARATAAAATAGHAASEGRVLSTDGHVHETILAQADPAGLIVIGRHGKTALVSSPFGGVVHKVVGMAPGPVLVVKP